MIYSVCVCMSAPTLSEVVDFTQSSPVRSGRRGSIRSPRVPLPVPMDMHVELQADRLTAVDNSLGAGGSPSKQVVRLPTPAPPPDVTVPATATSETDQLSPNTALHTMQTDDLFGMVPTG